MIKKLQRKFIIVAMSSIFAVLMVIIGALNVASYVNLINKADMILDVLVENDAKFPKMFGIPDEEDSFERKELPEDWEKKQPSKDVINRFGLKGQNAGMSVETPYETRFFTVRIDKNGTVHTVDTGKIAAINTKTAITYAEQIYEKGKERGFVDVYRYRMVEKDAEYMIIFIDRSRERADFHMLMNASVFLSCVGMLAVFCLVYVFSRKVFKPVEISYQKQKRFITDASHELKTPITIISANVELLEMEYENNAWTKSIQNQVQRLTSLTEQMVMLSRMDEEAGEKNSAKFLLSEAIVDVADSFVPLAKSQEKELEIQVEEGLYYEGDEKQIRQMISLLLDNAVKYASNQGRILLQMKRKGKQYQIIVWNTVEQMNVGNMDVLFERFYRLDSSRNSQTGGSGIGLSVVKAVVERHSGKIRAKSDDGKSLEIEIIL